MKRLGVLLTTLAVAISAWCGPVTSSEAEASKPPDWQPLIGYVHPTQKAFYDKNNMHREGDMSGGSFLFYDTTPTTIIIRGRPLVFKSVVKHVVVDCEDNLLLPMFDVFYSVDKPGDNDTPLNAIEYQTGQPTIMKIRKTSLLYQTLCPIQT